MCCGQAEAGPNQGTVFCSLIDLIFLDLSLMQYHVIIFVYHHIRML